MLPKIGEQNEWMDVCVFEAQAKNVWMPLFLCVLLKEREKRTKMFLSTQTWNLMNLGSRERNKEIDSFLWGKESFEHLSLFEACIETLKTNNTGKQEQMCFSSSSAPVMQNWRERQRQSLWWLQVVPLWISKCVKKHEEWKTEKEEDERSEKEKRWQVAMKKEQNVTRCVSVSEDTKYIIALLSSVICSCFSQVSKNVTDTLSIQSL